MGSIFSADGRIADDGVHHGYKGKEEYDIKVIDISEDFHGYFGSSHLFSGICAVAGKAVAAPSAAGKLLVFDPVTEEVKGIDISGIDERNFAKLAGGGRQDWNKFAGICEVGGKAVAAPSDADKLLVFDPVTEEVKGIDISEVAHGSGKFSGICAVAGKAVAAPHNANKLLVFDPVTEEVKGIDISGVADGKQKFDGICEVAGKAVAAPKDARKLLVFDPVTEEVKGIDASGFIDFHIGVTPGNGLFHGICKVDGKAVAAPFHSDHLLVFDPVTEELKSIDITSVARGMAKFAGICDVAGKAVAAPSRFSSKLLSYDPVTEEVEGIDISGVVQGDFRVAGRFDGICEVAGKAVAAPYQAGKLLVWKAFEPFVPTVVQVFGSTVSIDSDRKDLVEVTCTTLGGNVIATITLELACDGQELRRRLATTLDVAPAALMIILPSGERLRDVGSTKPMRELLTLG